MKILVYSSYFLPYISGITVYIERVFSRLASDNTITLLTFQYKKELSNEEVYKNITVKRMPFLFKMSKGFISPYTIPAFFQELKKTQILFVTLPNVEALPLVLFAKLMNKKIIVMFFCEVSLGRKPAARFIEKIVSISAFIQLLLSDQIIMLPEYKKTSVLAKYFLSKIKEVNPPIPTISIDKEKKRKLLESKKDELWIGFVGRIAEEKGIEYLLYAIKKLKVKNSVRLIFAGPQPVGEDNYRKKIVSLLQEGQIKHKMLGVLTDEELRALYETLDLLVLPSINKTEAFGMVQAEAMICGCPVIATNLPGVNTTVRMTQMGELVRPKDSDDLADKIYKVLKFPDIYKKRKQLVQRIFSIEKTIEEYRKILVSFS